MSVRVVLAEGHRIMREVLRSLIDSETGLELVGEAETGQAAVQLVQDLSPEVVLLGLGMSDLSDTAASRQILAAAPHVKVVALSMYADGWFVQEMLDAGATGYLLKDCAAEELAQCIRTALSGEVYVSPDLGAVACRALTLGPTPACGSGQNGLGGHWVTTGGIP